MTNYDYNAVKKFIETTYGVAWDEQDAAVADEVFDDIGLHPSEVARLVLLHTRLMLSKFHGPNYTFKQRVFLAIHFLLGRKVRGL